VYRTTIFIILLLLVGNSCRKEYNSRIPYVYIDYIIYPNSIDYIPVGGSAVFKGGYRGIIIYRPMPEQFMVFERCCPYDPEKTNARVNPEPGGATCIDTVCKSRYILVDGTPFAGPSSYALFQYRWSYNGDILHIFN
jgi:hypothetical protein